MKTAYLQPQIRMQSINATPILETSAPTPEPSINEPGTQVTPGNDPLPGNAGGAHAKSFNIWNDQD